MHRRHFLRAGSVAAAGLVGVAGGRPLSPVAPVRSLHLLSRLGYPATQLRLLAQEQLRNRYRDKSAVARYQLFLRSEPDITRRVSLRDMVSYSGITRQLLNRICRRLTN